MRDSEVTLHTHLTHPFIIVKISFYLRKLIQKALAELLSPQYLKEYPHLLLKGRTTAKKTNENATRRNFALDFVSFTLMTSVLIS